MAITASEIAINPMAINLTDRLLRNEVNTDELETFLLGHFGEPSMENGRRAVYGNRVSIDYNKKGEIFAIEWLDDAGEAGSQQFIDEAESRILQDHGLAVGSCFVFAGNPLGNVVRVDDHFQIAPLPDSAPGRGC